MGLLLKPPVGGANRVSPRVTDWSLALAGAAAFTSGLLGLFSGRPDEWLGFVFPGAAGVWVRVFLCGKVGRVLAPALRPRPSGPATAGGGPSLLCVALAERRGGRGAGE